MNWVLSCVSRDAENTASLTLFNSASTERQAHHKLIPISAAGFPSRSTTPDMVLSTKNAPLFARRIETIIQMNGR
ncbi:hypothetical protein [Fulvimarina sp. MAC3]|uniref:hypothetical protein n=1 Tax=Fulvimarina sp. MAC3 TaxID=3148887 RepID=UPI0031FCD133